MWTSYSSEWIRVAVWSGQCQPNLQAVTWLLGMSCNKSQLGQCCVGWPIKLTRCLKKLWVYIATYRCWVHELFLHSVWYVAELVACIAVTNVVEFPVFTLTGSFDHGVIGQFSEGGNSLPLAETYVQYLQYNLQLRYQSTLHLSLHWWLCTTSVQLSIRLGTERKGMHLVGNPWPQTQETLIDCLAATHQSHRRYL